MSREAALAVGGLPFRACLFFACNPDEYLYTSDIVEKFRVDPEGITERLRSAVKSGLIKREPGGPAGIPQARYTAGPRLPRASR